MDTLCLPTRRLPSARRAEAVATNADLVVVGFGDPVATGYAAHVSGVGERVLLVDEPPEASRSAGWARAVIVFLPTPLSKDRRRAVEQWFRIAADWGTKFVGIVSTSRVDLGDGRAAEAEDFVAAQARDLGVPVRVFRAGHVLCAGARATAALQRFGFAYPLVPAWLNGCCVAAAELYAALDHERRCLTPNGGTRVYTLLGPRRPWRDWLAEHRATRAVPLCLTWVCMLLALTGIGQLAGIALFLLARYRASVRWCNVGTLRPASLRDLIALCNRYNCGHVKVVGYNNGVVHFGHRYPGKTIVSTVGCNRARLVANDRLKADCGTTVRQARNLLAAFDRALPVMPNYSYVCLGTAFFVPIHGSASDFSTIADTITRVLLYDPRRDRLIVADRDQPGFGDSLYDMQANVLVLRIYLQVKPQSSYRVRTDVLRNPASAIVMGALRDRTAANVEIRKANAASDLVTVSRYYNEGANRPVERTLPRDALGGVWDRLEENPVTSFLMHAFARYCIWHVELFFTAEEFARFWETHRHLPLRKLQMRFIRQDGMPHSPFRSHECVSVDLFMLRRHRRTFEVYLRRTFSVVRTNPGKHSR
jgi:hypothetical protein